MELEIRKLGKEDAAAYWALRLEALERESRSFGKSPEEHRLSTIEDAAVLLEEDQTFVVGAFDGKALVAIVRFVRETGRKERHKGHIYGVYVTGSHRGQGLAGRLIAALIAAVRDETDVEQVLLSVGTFNEAARSVYCGLGFVSCGIEPRALKVDGQYVDEENMILIF